jgi:hypothetical protein
MINQLVRASQAQESLINQPTQYTMVDHYRQQEVSTHLVLSHNIRPNLIWSWWIQFAGKSSMPRNNWIIFKNWYIQIL